MEPASVGSVVGHFKDGATRLTADAADSSVRVHGESALVGEIRRQGSQVGQGEAEQGAEREGAPPEGRRQRGCQSAQAGERPEAQEAGACGRSSGNATAPAGADSELHFLGLKGG
jgi:hypothetical protein